MITLWISFFSTESFSLSLLIKNNYWVKIPIQGWKQCVVSLRYITSVKFPSLIQTPINQSIVKSNIYMYINYFRKFWTCFKYENLLLVGTIFCQNIFLVTWFLCIKLGNFTDVIYRKLTTHWLIRNKAFFSVIYF
jgi:hypothetical protein